MSPSKTYSAGDLVFAKVRGWSPWPATVIRRESQSKYRVYFHDTRQEGSVKEEFIWPYKENKMAFTKKYGRRKGYKAALRQIEILEGSSGDRSEESSEETGAGVAPLNEDCDKDDECELGHIVLEYKKYESEKNISNVDNVVEVNVGNGLEDDYSTGNLINKKSNNEARTAANNEDREAGNEVRNAAADIARSAWCTDPRLPPGWQMMWYPGGSLNNVYRAPNGALFKTLDSVIEALENLSEDANSKVEEAVKEAKHALQNLNRILMFKQEIESDHEKFNRNLNTIYQEGTSQDKLKTQTKAFVDADVDLNKDSIECVNDTDVKIEDTEENDEETTYWNTLYNAAARPPVPNFYINPFFQK